MHFTRRRFIKSCLGIGAASLLSTQNLFGSENIYDIDTNTKISNGEKMVIQLPDLQYDFDALAPYISPEALELHYAKHHKGYVNKVNELLPKAKLETTDLLEIIKTSHKKRDKPPELNNPAEQDPEKESAIMKQLFDNSAQVYNHTFFWQSMKKNGGGNPDTHLMKKIKEDFNSFEAMVALLNHAAVHQFGSGWAWLIYNKGSEKLQVLQTANGYLPLVEKNMYPLLNIDVWEHAYYIDYQNRRPEYVSQFFEKIVNWNFATENYNRALAAD